MSALKNEPRPAKQFVLPALPPPGEARMRMVLEMVVNHFNGINVDGTRRTAGTSPGEIIQNARKVGEACLYALER